MTSDGLCCILTVVNIDFRYIDIHGNYHLGVVVPIFHRACVVATLC